MESVMDDDASPLQLERSQLNNESFGEQDGPQDPEVHEPIQKEFFHQTGGQPMHFYEEKCLPSFSSFQNTVRVMVVSNVTGVPGLSHFSERTYDELDELWVKAI
jgi:hypothetical protein